MVLDFASFVCTIGEEAALGGPILSGIGLSGSDRDERDSNLLDISREAVVSNNEDRSDYLRINRYMLFQKLFS